MAGLLFVFQFTGCSDNEKLPMDVPEGLASNTLKVFARQARVEIIYDSESIGKVNTNAVAGTYDPRSALRVMLDDTTLTFVYDNTSGAYAIVRNEGDAHP